MATVTKWAAGLLIAIMAGGAGLAYRSHAVASQQARIDESLTTARSAFEAGDATRAVEALRWVVDEAPSEDALALMAQSLEAQQKRDAALDVWQRLAQMNPETPFLGEIRLAEAQASVRQRDFIAARQLLQGVQRDFRGTEAALRAGAGLMEIEWHEGRLAEARTIGLSIVEDPALPAAEQDRVAELLGRINLDMLYSRQPQEGDEIYTVRSGDAIVRIASQHGISPELLMRVNGIRDARTLSVGHRLKIPRMSFRLVVDKWNNTLTVYANDAFFKRYRVRTGTHDYMTPVGSFTIINKKENPQWTRPGTNVVIAGGAPENELGTRWMAFQGSQLGIHGTIRPETIGLYSSQGCVGLLTADVEELYEYIPVGATLEIKGQQNPEILRRSQSIAPSGV